MKSIKYIVLLLITVLSCNSKVTDKFSEAALNDSFKTLQGDNITLQEILNTQKGKIIVIDIWASWCSDCIKGMPKVKALQEAYPEAAYVFLSLDKTQEAWARGIKKYNVQGEHYFMSSGKASPFGKFVNIDWIPRYMVVDANGNIKLFKAIEADDKNIKQSLIK